MNFRHSLIVIMTEVGRTYFTKYICEVMLWVETIKEPEKNINILLSIIGGSV